MVIMPHRLVTRRRLPATLWFPVRFSQMAIGRNLHHHRPTVPRRSQPDGNPRLPCIVIQRRYGTLFNAKNGRHGIVDLHCGNCVERACFEYPIATRARQSQAPGGTAWLSAAIVAERRSRSSRRSRPSERGYRLPRARQRNEGGVPDQPEVPARVQDRQHGRQPAQSRGPSGVLDA